jgi:hypothetical protein
MSLQTPAMIQVLQRKLCREAKKQTIADVRRVIKEIFRGGGKAREP